MKYIYFVSFSFLQEDKSSGFGNTSVWLKEPIIYFDRINFVADIIKKQVPGLNKNSNIVIINYILLRTEEAE